MGLSLSTSGDLSLRTFKMTLENLNNEFNTAVSQFSNTENFLERSKKLGDLLLEEKEDFWKIQGQQALSVLLAQFLSVSKEPGFNEFVSFIKGIASPVTGNDLSETVKSRFRDEAERFLTQSPQTMSAVIDLLKKNIARTQCPA